MDLIDTHCHLDASAFDPDRESVLAGCAERGIRALVLPGVTASGWDVLLAVAKTSGRLHPALGLHPWFIGEHRPEHLDALAERVAREPLVAIGEIGIDHYPGATEPEGQKRLFEAQLDIARDAALPVILHVRKAHDAVYSILRRRGHPPGGVAHAFSGSLVQARRYVDLGLRLGFGGAVTHARARKLRDVLRALPREAIVLETDAPDMPPAGHHGERNTPLNLPEILRVVAEVRGEDPEEVAAYTTANARALFGI
ncbi:TatD family hydrolase [Thioalbus denitrificans]|uniref:TatD DNase family protein n=1 Tax=Thioalbus denitrificans TaxID=547122 RepID=A0A369C9K6_9GAMM|nr:TatD family hydrolase [Thioalbus denitrificans]RCX29848.1 TatD DNase family protein [Thioalbus denitrificans]